MKATKLYRIASGLLFIWAAGNTYGLLNFWHVAGSMDLVRFPVGHSGFSYAEVVLACEVFCSFCVLFAAYLAWHLGTLSRTMPKAIGAVGWILFACSVAGVFMSWIAFSGFVLLLTAAIAICIGWATWLSTAHRETQQRQSERGVA
jgi:multisubunit Na+/H+ antiporter MnhG subunit